MIIQRIQTIYLLISAICCALLVYTPYTLANDVINFSLNLPLTIATAIVGLIAVIAIFLFKKAKIQLSFCKFLIFSFLIIAGVMAYVLFDKQLFSSFNHEWIFAPLGFLTSLLAHRGISSDIKKIKSMDRLR